MFRSLRWRLQAWHALILLLVIVGMGSTLTCKFARPGSTKSTVK